MRSHAVCVLMQIFVVTELYQEQRHVGSVAVTPVKEGGVVAVDNRLILDIRNSCVQEHRL